VIFSRAGQGEVGELLEVVIWRSRKDGIRDTVSKIIIESHRQCRGRQKFSMIGCLESFRRLIIKGEGSLGKSRGNIVRGGGG